METVIIAVMAFDNSLPTFLSGFGLLPLVITATAVATGNKLLKKSTFSFIQKSVAAVLTAIPITLGINRF